MLRTFLLIALALFPGPAFPATVNDFSRLNPIQVDRVESPTSVEQVAALVRGHAGPISIGGGRYSMGGQIATENALFLDMRRMDRVLDVDPAAKLVTVQAGATWRKVQETVDKHDLSLAIMQSYANFTVGGSLSVNVHGRYVGKGPIIGAVRSIRIVLADGTTLNASRTENPELFYGAIGGYGGLGVIVSATLELAPNEKMERKATWVPVAGYRALFDQEVRNSESALLHNGFILPPKYDQVAAVTFSRTDLPLTIEDRLYSRAGPGAKVMQWVLAEIPLAKEARSSFLEKNRLEKNVVVWRNYEASYDVADLQPTSRRWSTYVLQEYFVPVARFEEFIPKMRTIFKRHGANVLNVSIRHASKDPGSLLAWAKEESFAFVIYYKQGTGKSARKKVAQWTAELIDAATELGGTYYLPYQIVASDEQFRKAYPRADEFFALKQRFDPTHKFRNKLWDKYYRPK